MKPGLSSPPERRQSGEADDQNYGTLNGASQRKSHQGFIADNINTEFEEILLRPSNSPRNKKL